MKVNLNRKIDCQDSHPYSDCDIVLQRMHLCDWDITKSTA